MGRIVEGEEAAGKVLVLVQEQIPPAKAAARQCWELGLDSASVSWAREG